MNLREFLTYRTNCLCCGSKLNVNFHSSKKQSNRLENNKFIVTFPLRGIKKGQQSYKFSYVIDLEDNSFYIEFYNNDGVHWYNNHIPIWLLERYQELDMNHGKYRFQIYCDCDKYTCTSNFFTLNYGTSIIEDLKIDIEIISFSKKDNNTSNIKLYNIVNYHHINQTWFSVHKCDVDNCNYQPEHVIKISMIAPDNIDNLINRLDKLMIFS